MDDIQKNQETNTEDKVLYTVIIEGLASGKRNLKIQTTNPQEFDPPMSIIRETLDWAKNFLNDQLTMIFIQSMINSVKDEKIIKPGFRPKKILDLLRGK